MEYLTINLTWLSFDPTVNIIVGVTMLLAAANFVIMGWLLIMKLLKVFI